MWSSVPCRSQRYRVQDVDQQCRLSAKLDSSAQIGFPADNHRCQCCPEINRYDPWNRSKGRGNSPCFLSAVHQPKEYSISAKSLAVAAKAKSPVSGIPVVGERPLLVIRKVLSTAIRGMNIQHIAIERDGDGHRFPDGLRCRWQEPEDTQTVQFQRSGRA